MLIVHKSEGLRCSQLTLKLSSKNNGACPSAHASLLLSRLQRVVPLRSRGDLRSLRGGKHPAEATAHAPSGQPHPHGATSKVTHRVVQRSVQRGCLEHSAVNSSGRVLASPRTTTMLSQLNSRNLLWDPPRAAASVARPFGARSQKEPLVRRPPSSAVRSAAGRCRGAFFAVISGFRLPVSDEPGQYRS